ncbi:MAG: hypothetical protein K8W52_26180 [Deltaproteobacteria bacterium]|nr:hypothetical protein [Deltaproteobacteria bacterium]
MARAVVLATLVLAAACGHKSPSSTGSGGPAPLIKRVVLTWDSGPINRNAPEKVKVYLVATDETGSATSYPVSEATGTCGAAALAEHDLTAYACTAADGTSVRFHATHQAADVVVLAEKIEAGADSDLMNASEVRRVTLPIDAKIEGGT